MSKLKHPNISPFYEWLDHDEIRDIVHRALDMPPGERLVAIKGLVPGLVDAVGIEELEDFLDELAIKARRYDEARRHPGEGRRKRRTPGELIGGATPSGHAHADERRDPGRPGGRYAERERERALWREAARRGGRHRRPATPLLIGVAAVAAASGALMLLASRGRLVRPPRGPGRPARPRRPRGLDRVRAVERDVELANRYDRYAG